ncbi:MAG TPA: hypothetical protein VIJ00_19505 [Nakamurella sp.]
MTNDVALLDLRRRRRSMIGYTVGMGVYAFVIVALYPSFRNDTSLNQFTENGSTVAALFGANAPLTTPAGWLNAKRVRQLRAAGGAAADQRLWRVLPGRAG